MGAPAKHTVRFRLSGSGHQEGDDRSYDVIVSGRTVGVVEREPGRMIDPNDSAKGWAADGFGATIRFADGSRASGSGSTRYAAVADAYRTAEA